MFFICLLKVWLWLDSMAWARIGVLFVKSNHKMRKRREKWRKKNKKNEVKRRGKGQEIKKILALDVKNGPKWIKRKRGVTVVVLRGP